VSLYAAATASDSCLAKTGILRQAILRFKRFHQLSLRGKGDAIAGVAKGARSDLATRGLQGVGRLRFCNPKRSERSVVACRLLKRRKLRRYFLALKTYVPKAPWSAVATAICSHSRAAASLPHSIDPPHGPAPAGENSVAGHPLPLVPRGESVGENSLQYFTPPPRRRQALSFAPAPPGRIPNHR
jgi:hypothetical protein